LSNDIKIDTTEQYTFCSYGNQELQDSQYTWWGIFIL